MLTLQRYKMIPAHLKDVLLPRGQLMLAWDRGPEMAMWEHVAQGDDIVIGFDQPGEEVADTVWSQVPCLKVGTVAKVHYDRSLAKGRKIVLQGKARFLIHAVHASGDGWDVEGHEMMLQPGLKDTAVTALKDVLMADLLKWKHHGNKDEWRGLIRTMADTLSDEEFLDDVVTRLLDVSYETQCTVLQEPALDKRYQAVHEELSHKMEVERIKKTIHARMSQVLEQRQKDIMDQLRNEAIRAEMGEDNEVEVLAKKIATTPMSQEAERKASNELRKLRQMNAMSSEAVVIRHYLETLCDLPWNKRSVLQTKLVQAQAHLEVTHFGLLTIKQEISKHIAVHNRTKGKQGTVLCLVGPPGVGKTSLGRAIAMATHRQFAHIALGGVKDEAEIRGHRRTYVGSMPGKIIQEIIRCGTINPVFMLDEIDKIGQDWRGDPASSLLEVLDPEQNHSFVDHYLEVGFPLNECLFVCTANDVSAIPSALRDRMDVIQLSSYSQEEKVDIARHYLIKKQLHANGLMAKEFAISNDALIQLIRRYTREAGVRDLDRKIKSLAGQAVLLIDGGKQKSLRIQASNVEKYAGPPLYGAKESLDIERVGLMQGLAWSEYGGSVMSIETVLIPGKGKVISTGRLGKVMEESVSIAFSFLQSQAVSLGIDLTVMQSHDMHVHVPEGAIPKDGPSAGVAIFLAMCSTLLQRSIPRTMAVTGEISLTGQVLPIGGVKEKVLAAHRENIATVLLPEHNKAQWAEIPDTVTSQLRVVWLRHAMDAFHAIFQPTSVHTDVSHTTGTRPKSGVGDSATSASTPHAAMTFMAISTLP